MKIKINGRSYPAEKKFGVPRFIGHPAVQMFSKYVNREDIEKAIQVGQLSKEALAEYFIMMGYTVDAFLDLPYFQDWPVEVIE